MAQTMLTLFDLYAAVHPDGRAERMNLHRRKTFKSLYDAFDSHDDWRWLLVTIHTDTVVLIIDLWQTVVTNKFPYVEPFIVEPPLDTVDQAVGYVALHLC